MTFLESLSFLFEHDLFRKPLNTFRDHALCGRSRGHSDGVARAVPPVLVACRPVAIEIEHEQANGRRQVAVLSVGVDRGDELRQGHVPLARNLLQTGPESILETDAGLMTSDDNGAFDHPRFHRSSPVSIRWRSRSRLALASRSESRTRWALLRPCSSRLAAASRSASSRCAFLRALRRLTTSPILHSTM